MEVSVLIIVRNGAATILRQLDALAEQVGAPDFEVIIADNGSTDGTSSIVRAWCRNGIGAISGVRLVDASARRGIPYTRNVAAVASRGRLLAWCDSDDRVHPGWVRAYSENVTTEVAGGPYFFVDHSGKPISGMTPGGLLPTRYLPYFSNCNLAINRRAFMAVGGYDESLPPYGAEDLELCWRLQESGHAIVVIPEASIDYTMSNRRQKLRKEYLAAVGRIASHVRHPNAWGDDRPSLTGLLRDFITTLMVTPWRLLQPGYVSRAQRVRSVVEAAGYVAGYWTYGVQRRPPRLLQTTGGGDTSELIE